MYKYVAFFIGIIFSRSMVEAYCFGILAGMANSFLDSGTYPALMELYPKNQASANIMIKAFASVGELILPILVATLEHFKIWYGWSFVFCGIALIVNFILVHNRKFPTTFVKPKEKKKAAKKTAGPSMLTPKRVFLGVVLTIFGYISMATFYLVSQWLTQYGMNVGLDMTHARMLVSIYSVGSIVGVITTAVLVERVVKPVWFMLFDTFFSFVALLTIVLVPNDTVMNIASFVIGCTAAGGVMQIGLTLMGDLFPAAKGRITGIYYTASGLASFSIPVLTAIISKSSIVNIMWFDVAIAAVGIICSLIVLVFYRKDVVPKPSSEEINVIKPDDDRGTSNFRVEKELS
ncbi:inner membrane transport protein YdiM [Lentilactobacillus sunkii]|jgi:predicted MFS family arabinose efflux permease|uniref:Inner membrane transport protein YdiM n=1 Tax=Lentilactobacillus sunkii TaxID=481719 RepID=A0A1E7XHJ5_9LACO|nr:inner membrane transport protein YdiM [Lentilactobacillus sunkii]